MHLQKIYLELGHIIMMHVFASTNAEVCSTFSPRETLSKNALSAALKRFRMASTVSSHALNACNDYWNPMMKGLYK